MRYISGVLAALFVGITGGLQLGAQSAPAPRWSGWARCQIDVSGPGYVDRQTHTWTIVGDTATVEGAFRVFRGTWSVVGSGSLQRSQGTQTLTAQWTTNAANVDAPIAVFVRASDGRAFIQARHAQLRARAIQGSQQLVIDGKPQTPGPIAADAFEWAFPVVAVTRPAPGASLIASGSSAPAVNGPVGLMQPAGTNATASCTWQFAEGAGSVPAPPAAIPATPTAPPAVSSADGPAPTSVATATPPPPTPPTSVPTTPPPTSSTSTPPTSTTPTSTPPTSTPPASASTPPASTSPPASSGATARADLFTTIDADPRVWTLAVAWWPPSGTAKYDVELGNAGPAAADGATVAVPAVAGLSKTTVTCTARSGARCPASMTVAQLESGVAIPTLPANGYVRIAFAATVTGALGSSVTVTSTATAPAGARDPFLVDNTDRETHSILVASTSSSGSTPALASPSSSRTVAPGGAPALSPSICSLPGPVLNTPTASPIRASLTWPHINGATYTVSRNDVGLVTPAPLTSPVYPATIGFNHDAPLYFHTSYVYTIVATYGQGCGTSTVSVTAPRPFVPVVSSRVLDRTGGRYSVFLTWSVPTDYWTPLGDNDGFLVLGPDLPAAGHEEPGCWRPKCIIVPSWTKEVTVAAGEYTWIVTPYWETPSGRMIDVSSGARITVKVP
jgi:hypothetical protein